MDNLVYRHNRKIIVISIVASVFLFLISVFQTYQIFLKHGIHNTSFLIGAGVSIFFIFDVIIMYFLFAHQTITVDLNTKTITMSQTNKLFSTDVSINFDNIKQLNLIEIGKNQYDIQITLKNNQEFLLFAFGDYCSKDKETISEQLELIKQAISYNNNFFFTDNKK